jgi:hypothetical protein
VQRTKTCNRCGQVKSIGEYERGSGTCKTCRREQERQREPRERRQRQPEPEESFATRLSCAFVEASTGGRIRLDDRQVLVSLTTELRGGGGSGPIRAA